MLRVLTTDTHTHTHVTTWTVVCLKVKQSVATWERGGGVAKHTHSCLTPLCWQCRSTANSILWIQKCPANVGSGIWTRAVDGKAEFFFLLFFFCTGSRCRPICFDTAHNYFCIGELLFSGLKRFCWDIVSRVFQCHCRMGQYSSVDSTIIYSFSYLSQRLFLYSCRCIII